jgi:hypothetical protein
MSTQYLVIAWGKSKNPAKAKFEKYDTIEEAEKREAYYSKFGYDTVVVKKQDEDYQIMPNGVWKTYRFVRKILFLVGMSILAIIFYLYFKFFNLKK